MAVIRISLTSLSFGAGLAPLVKEARTTIGWPHRELADNAMVSQALIWRLESA